MLVVEELDPVIENELIYLADYITLISKYMESLPVI